MRRESTAIRRGCCTAELGQLRSAEESPAVDCMEAETEQSAMQESKKGHSKAKYWTELNLKLKAQKSWAAQSDSHQSNNNNSSQNSFIYVISWRWRAEYVTDIFVLVSALLASRMKGVLCVGEMSLKSTPSVGFITKLMQLPRREQWVQFFFSSANGWSNTLD